MFINVFGFLIIVGFFFMELVLRRGSEAKSWEAGKFDQSSTRFIVLSYIVCGIALFAASPLNKLNIAVLPQWTDWLGIIIALAGLGFRIWSMSVLGKFYTRTLKVSENQSIVRDGPYSLIRHPGYLGSILIWVGIAASATNGIILLFVLAVFLGVYIYRIQSEEKMLVSAYPDYAEYRLHTWRLIPLVY